jgi:hydroxymethylpyrimidine pyrophosphatase-like HAD family hydrolase
MTKPRIIAFDLDDTLLKDDLSISDYTVHTLQKAVAEGIYIVLASGRADNAILPTVRRLNIAGTQQGRYIIGLNGASITDLHLRSIIYHQFLPKEIALCAYEFLNDKEINCGEELNCHIYDENTIYVPRNSEFSRQDAHLSGFHVEVVDNFRALIGKKERP